MKKTVFFLLFAFSAVGLHSQNLVVNPGLENWTSAIKPYGWSASEGCTMEGTIVNSGVYSCMQTAGSTGSKDMNQSIAIEPGKDYAFSVYFRTGAASAGNGGRIWCKWLNSGVDVTDEASKVIMQTGYLTNPVWQQYSFTVKAPPSATTFLLQVRTLSSSITYWDDFVFEESVATGITGDTQTTPVIYPVPADDYIFIRNASGIESIEIIDLSGNVMKSLNTPAEYEIRIDVGDLRKGFYVLKMKHEGRVEFRKFIKK